MPLWMEGEERAINLRLRNKRKKNFSSSSVHCHPTVLYLHSLFLSFSLSLSFRDSSNFHLNAINAIVDKIVVWWLRNWKRKLLVHCLGISVRPRFISFFMKSMSKQNLNWDFYSTLVIMKKKKKQDIIIV